MKQWGVWCEVWGGVTGCRASWLKENGQPVIFLDKGKAEVRAEAMMETNARSPYRKAEFLYTVREIFK